MIYRVVLAIGLSLTAMLAMAQPAPKPLWHDPLDFPVPPASVQAEAQAKLRRQSGKAIRDLPQGIRSSINRSMKRIHQNLTAERSQALAQMGIDPHKTGYLTILVSTSMPDNMIAGYAQQAVWTGGVVTFRGIKKGKTIGWFIRHVMKKWIRPGASPTMTLDPRPFSAYGITAVPAIVYTQTPPGQTCNKSTTKTVKQGPNKPPLKYQVCAPADPDSYWKITGAVSVRYALRQFARDGASGAALMLRAATADPYGLEKKPVMLTPDAYAKAAGPGSISDVLHLMGLPPPDGLFSHLRDAGN